MTQEEMDRRLIRFLVFDFSFSQHASYVCSLDVVKKFKELRNTKHADFAKYIQVELSPIEEKIALRACESLGINPEEPSKEESKPENKGEWISVGDSEPVKDGMYLCAVRMYDGYKLVTSYRFQDGGWNNPISKCVVTHWMKDTDWLLPD